MKLVPTTAIALASLTSVVAFSGVPPSARAARSAAPCGNTSAARESRRAEDGGGPGATPTRRETLATWFAGAATIGLAVAAPDEAAAFDNRISKKYDDRPKQRGAKPQALGVSMRKDMLGGSEEYLGLKQCGAAPNCFCSTDPIDDSPETNIPPFQWPKDVSSREEAFRQLGAVVQGYEPGQAGIDGGGFDVVTLDPAAGYLYAQFQSLKNGYVDDLEFAAIGEGGRAVQVRSSSRLGYLDYGVNAKRLNYLAGALRAKGWNALGVDLATHRGYALENELK